MRAWIAVLLLAFAFNADAVNSKKLTITGSSTVAPLASELAKKFEAKNPGVRIDIQTGGSSRGVNDQRQGLNDIGMVSRALNPDETDLQAHTIARDGICIILHKTNPVSSLTSQQVVDIYTGKIKNWKDVGGKDAPITVVSKAEGRSTLELFLSYFKLKNSEVKSSVLVGDNEQDVKTVVGNPNSIGYVSIGTAEYGIKHGVAIKSLPLEGVAPSTENVLNGKFALARPLNFVTKSKPEGLVKQFIEFAQSKEAVSVVKDQFFVPLAK
ncbi:MAG: phosphate ABC transporter substrate-binding protein [Bdellovibrionota bacterium]